MTPAPNPTATAALTDIFNRGLHHARRRHEAGERVVAASWPTVPSEVIRAAGLFPWVAREDPSSTPLADARLERGVFSSRIRTLVEIALRGDLQFARLLIVPRTSEQDYKAFLYLREFARDSAAPVGYPALHLLDLLQSATPVSRTYSEDRVGVMAVELESIGGNTITRSGLELAIAASNRARKAARAVLALRQPEARISGSDALPLLGAFWLMPHEEYAQMAMQAAAEWTTRPPLTGPHLLLAGAALDHTYPPTARAPGRGRGGGGLAVGHARRRPGHRYERRPDVRHRGEVRRGRAEPEDGHSHRPSVVRAARGSGYRRRGLRDPRR